MRAARIDTYGDASVIKLQKDIPKPTLKPGQVLVEVYAASINPFDWKLRTGYMQKMIPITFPVTIGGDFAGKVTEVSDDITDLKIGDEVYGQAIFLNGGSGTFAEYATANNTNTALKPTSVDFLQAGALPLVGTSVVQALE